MQPDDFCPRPLTSATSGSRPLVEPIHLSTVYQCEDPADAAARIAGDIPGYVYRRDNHPNAQLLADQCALLHHAPRAAIFASGMSALGAVLLALLKSGDHLIASSQLYGRSLHLLTSEAARLGIDASVVDTCDLAAVRNAFTPKTRLVVAETITNPLLRVSDIPALSELAGQHEALLLIDNTFASPVVCRPLTLGADLVLESLTKIMNGHSDVLLGLLCGHEAQWERIPQVATTWGLGANPFECWLAARGLGTLALRVEKANANAREVARQLARAPGVERVIYPGLPDHPDHALAQRQFGECFGTMISFSVSGGLEAATSFIRASQQIPFCPSLGELSTTLSHPRSTSHRAMSDDLLQQLGITENMIRLSVGIESPEFIMSALHQALEAVAT